MNKHTITTPWKKVMIVDDNEIDLYIGQRSIEMSGFAHEVLLYDSPLKALEYLRSLAKNAAPTAGIDFPRY